MTSDALPQPVPADVFDPATFDDLRDLLGAERVRASLVELSTTLQESFPDMKAERLDPDQVFSQTHFLVARAGLMGFVALRNACLELQDACRSRPLFGAEYSRTQEAALATRKAITVLLQWTA